MRSSNRTRGVAVALGVAAVGALAACGDAAKPSAHAAAPAAKAPTPAKPAGAAPRADDASGVPAILRDVDAWDAASSGDHRAAADAAGALLPLFAFVRMEPFNTGGASHELAVFRHIQTGLDFSLIPGGAFDMGSPPVEPGRGPDEARVHVRLTSPFLLCRTECTQQAWDKVMTTDPSRRKGPRLPVESVSWSDAAAFCSRTGLALPTEAQWEYACRAGTRSRYTTGDDAFALAEFGWVGDAKGTSHPVGMQKANAFGLFDMHGNVAEFCADGYAPRTEGGDATDPVHPPDLKDPRVVRGGGWAATASRTLCAARDHMGPDATREDVGFRPAFTLPPPRGSAAQR